MFEILGVVNFVSHLFRRAAAALGRQLLGLKFRSGGDALNVGF